MLLYILGSNVCQAQQSFVDSRTTAAILNESILFYAGFDHDSAQVDLAQGSPDPIQVSGTLRFVEGRIGHGLVIGSGDNGARIQYSGRSHLDLRKSGALSFWVRPLKWTPISAERRGYVVFLQVVRQPSVFVIERMGFDRETGRQDSFIAGYFDLLKTKRLAVTLAGTESWNRVDWHLVVVNWDDFGVSASLDGTPFVHHSSPTLIETALFVEADQPLPFQLGGGSSETSVIDEFAIYHRPLTHKEATLLWNPF
jgi:hypothetical protein